MSERSNPQPDADRLHELLFRLDEDPGDLDIALTRIADIAREIFSADFCIVFAINPLTGRFLLSPTAAGLEIMSELPLSPPREDGLARRILDRGVLFIEDLAAHPEYESEFSRRQHIESFAAAALRTFRRDEPLGVLYLDFHQRRQFSEEDREALHRFTLLAARKLESTWFLRRYRAVARAGQEINQGVDDPGQLFRKLYTHLGGILDLSRYFLFAVQQPQGGTVDFYTQIGGEDGAATGRRLKTYGWLTELPSSRLIPSLASESKEWQRRLYNMPGVREEAPQSVLLVPLLFEGVSLGVLSVAHPSPDVYDHEDRHILELMANHVALSLRNLRLFERLRKLIDAGQSLTRELRSDDVLQRIADLVQPTTAADLVILYPFVQATGSFELPAKCSGILRAKDVPQPTLVRPDDVAWLALQWGQPVFALDSRKLYERVGGAAAARRGNFEHREGIRSTAAVPLRVGEEKVGVLFFNFRTPQSFDDSQQYLVIGLANYAAIAIKNSRDFGAEGQRHVRELEILQELDRELNQTFDLRDLMRRFLQRAAELFKADSGAVLLFNPERRDLDIERAIGLRPEDWKEAFQRLREGGHLQTLLESQPVLVSGAGISEMAVPLLDGPKSMGLLYFRSSQPPGFDHRDSAFLSTLAGQAVLALKKAQAFQREKRLADDRKALIELAKEISRQREVAGMLDLILDRALEITESTAGVLLLIDPKQGDLVVAAEKGNPHSAMDERVALTRGIIGLAAREGAALNVNVEEPPWKEIYRPVIAETRSELAVPLVSNGKVRGIINVESPRVNHFKELDLRLLAALADLAVIALQNAKREQRMKALYDVGREILRQRDNPEGVLRRIIEQALDITDATAAEIDVYEDGVWTTTYQALAEGGVTEPLDMTDPRTEQPPRGIMAWVAQNRRPHKTTGDAARDPLFKGEPDVHDEYVIPLQKDEEGELFGILNIESTRFDAFERDEQDLLDLFAAQAVVAIENTRNYQSALRRQQRFQLLYQAGRELAEITDLSQIDRAYEVVLRIAVERCQSQVVIRRRDPQTGDLVLAAQAKIEGPQPFLRIPSADRLNGTVSLDRRTKVIDDADSLPPEEQFERSNPNDRAFLVTPILFNEIYYGNLALSHTRPYYFRAADRQLIEGLAQQLGITIYRLEEVAAHQEAERHAAILEEMRLLGEESYDMTHTIGNDLGLVPSAIEAIRAALPDGGTTNPVVDRKLTAILQDVQKVLQMSTEIRDDLLEAGGGEEILIPVHELIEEAVSSFNIPDGVRIETLPLPPDLGMVRVVHKQITAALHNLFRNSCQAMPGGGVLTVGGSISGRQVRLCVKDTGIGIKQEQVPRVFKLFYSSKGTIGFGLWRARRNVLRNQGNITVESKVGEGTTFFIDLPRAQEDSHV